MDNSWQKQFFAGYSAGGDGKGAVDDHNSVDPDVAPVRGDFIAGNGDGFQNLAGGRIWGPFTFVSGFSENVEGL